MMLVRSAFLIAGFILSTPAFAADAGAGLKLAREKCGQCHAVAKTGSSPLRAAPRFRGIANRVNPDDLQEALAEGIVVGHPGMPEFELSVDQIDNLIAHLKTLRRR